MHEEVGRLDVQLFADVLADLDQILPAFVAGASFRFVPVFDARQMLGQRLTTGTQTRRSWWRRLGRG